VKEVEKKQELQEPAKQDIAHLSREEAHRWILQGLKRLSKIGLPMAPDKVEVEAHSISKSKNRRKRS